MPDLTDEVVVRFYDPKTNRGYIFRDTMLLNHITRDAVEIAKSFDEALPEEFKVLSREWSLCAALLHIGRAKAVDLEDHLRVDCSSILSNALNSLASALTLLRSGFTLQPGIIIRTCIEAVALVFHLLQNPSHLSLFRSGELKSAKAISTAKKILPVFGPLYGSFSEKFTHIGDYHWRLNTIKKYASGDLPLLANLQFISSGIWLAYVATELAFIECVESPRYWKEQESALPRDNAYAYAPNEQELAWMEAFFNIGEG